jgi:hypothetical protein
MERKKYKNFIDGKKHASRGSEFFKDSFFAAMNNNFLFQCNLLMVKFTRNINAWQCFSFLKIKTAIDIILNSIIEAFKVTFVEFFGNLLWENIQFLTLLTWRLRYGVMWLVLDFLALHFDLI